MIKPPPPDHVGDPVQAPSRLNLPNALTVLRLVLVPVFAWLLLRDGGDDSSSRNWSAVVFLALSFTDLVDGEIARRRGQVTSFGKIADPIADKALTGTALVGLSYLGEVKTAFQMAAIVGYLLPVPEWLVPVRIALMAIALILTVATGVDYVVRALRLRAAAKATA